MSFLVTARKWRPRFFADVVGQEHITKTITNAIIKNRVAHAYIFAGPRGVGKTTTARILAKRLNCTSPLDGEPCDKCKMCQSFNTSQSMDVIEIDGASNRRIEEIRSLRETVQYTPTSGQYKVYIIDEVHMLTTESFNALLKTLEEPPSHTIFIFATTDVHKVPATILSRCQRFDFRRIELHIIKELLSKIAVAEGIAVDDNSLTVIAKKADGALRDAESLFDQVVSYCGSNVDFSVVREMFNIINDELYFELSEAVLQNNFAATFDITSKIYSNGWNSLDFLNGLIEHYRNILAVSVTGTSKHLEVSEEIKSRYKKYKGVYSEGDLLRILNFLNRSFYEIKSFPNEKLKLELILAHMVGFEKSSSISEIIKSLGQIDPEKKKHEQELSSAQNQKNETKKENQQPESVTETAVTAENRLSGNSIEEIRGGWEYFLSVIRKKKRINFNLIDSSYPEKIEGNFLIISLASGNGKSALESQPLFVQFLNKEIESIFSRPYILKFEVNKKNEALAANEESADKQTDLILSPESTELFEAVKEVLNGAVISTGKNALK